MVNFQYTVSALVYSLVYDRCTGAETTEPFLDNEVVRFVLAQYFRSPDFMRPPLRALTLVFDAWPLLTRGRTFHRLTSAHRIRQIDRWRTSRIAAMRDFIRYYEGLTIFGWYALRDESEHAA